MKGRLLDDLDSAWLEQVAGIGPERSLDIRFRARVGDERSNRKGRVSDERAASSDAP
jgi:hypothetical protein